MKILVTGGAGKVGSGVTAQLIGQGHEVRVLDWHIGKRLAGAVYTEGDITNYAMVREQARGMQGILHLAAYPNPMGVPGPEIFRVNCTGTYNVFEAAAAEGIRRVVCASSINALGFNFGVKSFSIEYFPVDEAHPTSTTDPYSFSKQTTEAIASYYWRRDGISSTCLRMPYVYVLKDEPDFWVDMLVQNYAKSFQKLLSMEEEPRNQLVSQMKAGLDFARSKRLWERSPETFNEEDWEGFEPEEDTAAFFGYTDFWSIISVEDAAQAFEKSLLREFEGSHALFVSEAHNTTGLESEQLLKIFYPEVTARKRPLHGEESLLCFDRARQLIGYEPIYCLRERIKHP